jgi:hypothetical protein
MNWQNIILVLGMVIGVVTIIFAYYFQNSSPFTFWSWKNNRGATRWIAALCWPATILLGLCANWWFLETPWPWWGVGVTTAVLGFFIAQNSYKDPWQWRAEKAVVTYPGPPPSGWSPSNWD